MTFVGVDQDHQVVSEPRVFDIGVLAVASDFPRSLQHLVHLIEVEIAEQGRDHAALRNTLLARGLEHKFQQMHDVLVVHPLSHFLQQPVMPDIVKVGSQIQVEDPRLPLSYCFRHSLDCVVCCPLGPISIRPRLEVRLEHRFEDELERTLHHSVPNRRDRKAADFAPVFRYLLLPGWEWLLGAPGQFVAQLLEQSLHALRLDALSLVLLFGIWISCLILGFGLLLWTAQVGSGVTPRPTLGAQLYMSGVTFFTLGYGDLVPGTRIARLLSVLEAGTGLGFIAVVIGYLPVLYQLFTRREAHVIKLDGRAGSPPTALGLLERHGGEDGLVQI